VKESDPEKVRAKWEAEVRKIIKDPGRAEKVIDLGVQVEVKHRAIDEEIDRLNQEIMLVNRNYDSTREDYEQAFQKFTEKKNEAVRQYLEDLFALRQQTTPKEWKALQR
jgi:ABC-type sulfate transport system substrate-binding protein